MYKESS